MTNTQNTHPLDTVNSSLSDAAAAATVHLYSDLDASVEAKLAGLAYVLEEVDVMIRRQVRSARSQGVTWEQIGNHLGVSKQAAQQRFGANI